MSFNLLPDELKHKILWMSIHSELSEYIHSERISIGCLDHNNADEDYWRPQSCGGGGGGGGGGPARQGFHCASR